MSLSIIWKALLFQVLPSIAGHKVRRERAACDVASASHVVSNTTMWELQSHKGQLAFQLHKGQYPVATEDQQALIWKDIWGRLRTAVGSPSVVKAIEFVNICAVAHLMYLSLKQRRSGTCTSAYMRANSMAWRSGVGFVVFLAAASSHAANMMPANLLGSFQWLAAWYVFTCCTMMGKLVYISWQTFVGSALMISAGMFLNCAMPGGASNPSEWVQHAWFPGGYTLPRAIICELILVYGLAACDIDQLAKFYGLAIFAPLSVAFLNPKADPTMFDGVVFYSKDNRFAWSSAFMSEFWMANAACIIAWFSFLPTPGFKTFVWLFGPSENRSSFKFIETELALLAVDLGGCFQKLLGCSHGDLSSFQLDSIQKCVTSWNERFKAADEFSTMAGWEFWVHQRRNRLAKLNHLCNLLKDLQLVMIRIIECLRLMNLESSGMDGYPEARLFLDNFCKQSCEALEILADPAIMASFDGLKWSYACEALELAQASLDNTQEHLLSSKMFLQVVLLDAFQQWLKLLHEYVMNQNQRSPCPDSEEEEENCKASYNWIAKQLQKHAKALKICLGYGAALAWSVSFNYSHYAPMSFAMLCWAKGSGSKMRSIINRFLGISSGTVLGGIPQRILTSDWKWNSPHGMVHYFVMCVLIWVTLSYYYLADGKYAGAAGMALAFASVQLTLDLQQMTGAVAVVGQMRANYYQSTLDVLAACLIVLFTEQASTWLSGSSTSASAGKSVGKALDECEAVVQRMVQGTPPCTRKLQTLIENAHTWNLEAHAENRLWRVPWKTDFVTQVLEQCSTIHVAVFALRFSMIRLGDEAARITLNKCTLDGLPKRIQQLRHAACATLGQEIPFDKHLKDCFEKWNVHQNAFHGVSTVSQASVKSMFEDSDHAEGYGAELRAENKDAAGLPLMHGVVLVKAAVQRLEVLLHEQMFLCFGHWGISGETG